MVNNQEFANLNYPKVDFRATQSLNWLLPACKLPSNEINNLPLNFDKPLGAFNLLIRLGLKGLFWSCPNLDENYPQSVVCVFNPEKSILWSNKWQIFYEFLKKLPNFKDIIDLDLGVMVLLLNLDIRGQEVLRCMKKGKYSEISDGTAREFYIGFKNNNSYQKEEYLIVKKSESYRQSIEKELDLPDGYLIGMELASKPIESEEIFSYKNRISI